MKFLKAEAHAGFTALALNGKDLSVKLAAAGFRKAFGVHGLVKFHVRGRPHKTLPVTGAL